MRRSVWFTILACIIAAIVALYALCVFVLAPYTARQNASSSSSASVSIDSVVDDPDLASKLPYPRLHEGLVQKTGLGEADELKTLVTSPEGREGTMAYYWYSANGKHDLLFAAYCKQQEVVEVARFLTDTDYWPQGQTLPDRHASGRTWAETEAARSATPAPTPHMQSDDPPDPNDYDDPEIYADEYDDWFASHGYSDPWNAAYDYWEEMY